MGQSYFVWNGMDCRSMGILMRGPAPIIRPEERVQHVTIPGRSGDMTDTEGDNIFNSYIQTVSFSVRGGYHVRDVYRWLRGSGFVTFSGEPDRKQAARVIGAITLQKHSRNLDWWDGEAQFYCQPLKQRIYEEKQTVTTSGETVYNAGDVKARPMLKVVPNASFCSFTVNNHVPALTISGLTSGTAIWIDCDTMEVLNADRSATITGNSEGDFPALDVGSNTLTFANVTSIEIEKRERFL